MLCTVMPLHINTETTRSLNEARCYCRSCTTNEVGKKVRHCNVAKAGLERHRCRSQVDTVSAMNSHTESRHICAWADIKIVPHMTVLDIIQCIDATVDVANAHTIVDRDTGAP